MSGQGKDQNDRIVVEEIMELDDEEQAEAIADHYAAISTEYEPLKEEDIPKELYEPPLPPPTVSEEKVQKAIKSMNKKASTVKEDIPMVLIDEYSDMLCTPLAHIINECFKQGKHPLLWKIEIITPVPKIYPPVKIKDLRRISGLKNLFQNN